MANGVNKTTSDEAEFDAYSADYKAHMNAALVVPGPTWTLHEGESGYLKD